MSGEHEQLLAGLPCKLGDVVVRRIEGDEAWLAGALVFLEERPIGALFVAPEAQHDWAVLTREARTEIGWLCPVRVASRFPGRDPPSTLEHDGLRFTRTRRTPVRIERLGTGAPPVGATAIVCEYAGPGAERYLLVSGDESTHAWRGVALAESDYEVLPSGEATLDH
jgi:hypothetical protein